ncbi:MAG: alpha/beta fold hydrolase, partial [Ilumatobacteraceae bacterium]
MARPLTILVTISLATAACSSGDSTPTTTSTTVAVTTTAPESPREPVDPYDTDKFPAPTIFWEDCGDNLKCGYVDVPVDYSDPASAETSLYIVRHAATSESKRVGVLLVNPGGPGFGGSYLAESATRIYDDALVESFDIIGWDPRGTGKSIPAIDCIDDYDKFFASGDATPDDEAERQESLDGQKEFTELCFEKSGGILPYSGTNNSARDMEMIRRALGEETISYFGFSYGSELGAIWATMYPDTVRAAVLDGAIDPNATSREMVTAQRVGFERSINAFLADCSARNGCSFHNDGKAEAAFDQLMIDLENEPLPTYPDRPELTRSMALTAVYQAMYSDEFWDVLAEALDDAPMLASGVALALSQLVFAVGEMIQ